MITGGTKRCRGYEFKIHHPHFYNYLPAPNSAFMLAIWKWLLQLWRFCGACICGCACSGRAGRWLSSCLAARMMPLRPTARLHDWSSALCPRRGRAARWTGFYIAPMAVPITCAGFMITACRGACAGALWIGIGAGPFVLFSKTAVLFIALRVYVTRRFSLTKLHERRT